MSIVNSPVLGHAAAEVKINLSGNNNSNPIEIVEWRTEEDYAEELELLVFPYGIGPRAVVDGSNQPPAFWANVAFELQVSVGAPTSGKTWSTSRYTVDRASADGVTPVTPAKITQLSAPNLWVPDRGLRLRFTCTSCRLRAVNAQYPVTCTIFAALTPCSGMETAPIPSSIAFPQPESYDTVQIINNHETHSYPWRNRLVPIPKGAREARVVVDDSAGFYGVEWGLYDGASASPQLEAAADWSEWRPMRGDYVYVALMSFGAPASDQYAVPAGEIQFR